MIILDTPLKIGRFSAMVVEDLGKRNHRVHYYKVRLESKNREDPDVGLLRVGSVTGALDRELQIREKLGNYPLVAPILDRAILSNCDDSLEEVQSSRDLPIEASGTESDRSTLESETEVSNSSQSNEDPESSPNFNLEEGSDTHPEDSNNFKMSLDRESLDENPQLSSKNTDNPVEADAVPPSEETNQDDCLEEECYPEEPFPEDQGDRLLLLTALPNPERTLSQWLSESKNPKDALKAIAQICQLFWYLYQNHWCVIDIDPDFLEIGQPIRCFDLTCAYPDSKPLESGLIGQYCAPELASNPTPDEKTSTYTIGALLYHALHGKPPQGDRSLPPDISPIPHFHQLLSLSLSPVSDERFPLAQLRHLAIETRNALTRDRVSWEIATQSTVGLSPKRLHNEDSYGISQIDRGESDRVVLAALADGMGGMAQGEVASRLAVDVTLEGLREEGWNDPNTRTPWLVSLVERANTVVSEAVRNGGTTLSVVLTVYRELSMAHVGDSRVYLLRKDEIKQLSEDHSLVALLVASGQISEEESQQHPDRNVLTKSLGSKKTIADGYVQAVSSFELQNGDIILLCSDGVWDLISDGELMELCQQSNNLQDAVNQAIARVLKRGAPDNATLIALRCNVSSREIEFNGD